MLGNTHAAVGAASGLIVLGELASHSPVALVTGATLGAIGGLMPDIGMFSDMDLTGVNFDYFVTTDVVTMAHMFEESTGISSDMLKHFSTGNVRTMSSMFSESDVEILDLSHFETNSLEYVSEMCRDFVVNLCSVWGMSRN